jgi:hypothetical protein
MIAMEIHYFILWRVLIDCEGDWTTHHWEVGEVKEVSAQVVLFCNQCGCEILCEVSEATA